MSDANIIEFFEIDVPRCANTYGETPCTAAVGVTGDFKCYNCPGTCQDPANYVADTALTLRFAKATEDLPTDIRAFASIDKIRIRPQEMFPAESIGTRESGTVSFFNHRDNDVLFDNYLADRGFNPYNTGTFWGKYVARYPNIQGYACRYIWGELGQALEDMEIRHYFVESKDGPDINGSFSFTFKDALKFLDGKKSVAPRPNTGRLSVSLAGGAASLTLTPTGIGDEEYGNDGIISIGDEAISYTRNTGSDVLTLTARGLFGTEDANHDEDETVQEALVISGQSPAAIIDTLIFDYTDTPATYANLSEWTTEVDQNLGRLYSANIMKPTPVKDLVSELILEAGLEMFTDIINQTIVLRILRQRPTVLALTDDSILPGTLRYKIDEEKRINAVYTYFGRRNPLLNLDEDQNYRGISVEVDADPVKALENLPLSIREIRSRWIAVGNRPAADDIGERLIDSYGDTAALVNFAISRLLPARMGSSITVASRLFEDSQGNERAGQPGIITRIEPGPTQYNCEAWLINFRQITAADRVIIFDEDALEVDLRAVHDLIYTEPGSGDIITVIVSAGVVITANSGPDRNTPANPAFDVGDWPAGTIINITIQSGAYIVGKGGFGGQGLIAQNGSKGAPGGVGLLTAYPINLSNNGILGGGGGGGGGGGANGTSSSQRGGGGGGGAALGLPTLPGQGGTGTLETGGAGQTSTAGGDGGDGGDLGQAGQAGDNGSFSNGGAGGAAGAAVDGDSFVTYSTASDIRGAQIN